MKHTHLALKNDNPYTRPEYYFRLFDEGRPPAAIVDDKQRAALDEAQRLREEQEMLDDLRGPAVVVPAPEPEETKVDLLKEFW